QRLQRWDRVPNMSEPAKRATDFCRPLRGLSVFLPLVPSDKSLGYSRSSAGADSNSADTSRFCFIAHNFSAGFFHLVNRLLAILPIDVDGAHRVGQRLHFESVANAVDDCLLDAVVRGQSANPHFIHPFVAQKLRELSSVET